MPDIHISGLTKQFGNTKVLKGLDLTVKDGEFLTLLGSSGCGKSTLLKLIAGLDQPDAGSIRLGERDLLALSPSQRDCAMVFQSYALYPAHDRGRQYLHATADARPEFLGPPAGCEVLLCENPSDTSGG